MLNITHKKNTNYLAIMCVQTKYPLTITTTTENVPQWTCQHCTRKSQRSQRYSHIYSIFTRRLCTARCLVNYDPFTLHVFTMRSFVQPHSLPAIIAFNFSRRPSRRDTATPTNHDARPTPTIIAIVKARVANRQWPVDDDRIQQRKLVAHTAARCER